MTIIKTRPRIVSLLAFALLSMLAALNFVQGSEAISVVVNPGVREQALSKNAVRAIFGMRLQTWPDGTPIRVFVLPDSHPDHADFSKGIVNVFPYQLRAAWDRLVFSGTGQAPFEVRTVEDMLAKVASTPGAIGYLRGGMVNDQVRALQIK